MEFPEFARLLKDVIGGSNNTKVFTKTLFEAMMNESGPDLLEGRSPETFKSYFNGSTSISEISKLVLANLDDRNFVEYLNSFKPGATNQLFSAFEPYIPGLTKKNISRKITDLFLEIIRTAASSEKKKSTPKSASKKEKTSHDIILDKMMASGKVIADAWGQAIDNMASELSDSNNQKLSTGSVLNEATLSDKDKVFLERFKFEATPILEYCIDHDPSAEGTKITLVDEIDYFLSSWKFDVRKIKDNTFRSLVHDTMKVLTDYTYYLSDKFLRPISGRNILWFRNESWEEGEQLRNVLQPESYKKRCELRDIYIRLYPIPEDNSNAAALEIPDEHSSDFFPYPLSDKQLLKEFTTDYDEIMVTLIGENYAASLIDMTLPNKINILYTEKWHSKTESFTDPSLKSYAYGLLGELNKLSKSFIEGNNEPVLINKTRTKIRNLYVKLHPSSFDNAIPYDAFIDDWNDGEF